MKKFLAIVMLPVVLAFFSPAAAEPPANIGSSRSQKGESHSRKPLLPDLSILSVRLNKPIKEGDTVGNSLMTITI